MATSAGLRIGLWWPRRLLLQRRLPPAPWPLPAAALILQMAVVVLNAALPGKGRSLLLHTLVNTYALVQLSGWALLQMPAALGLGQAMPKIIRDLLILAIAAVVTVLNLQQAAVNLVGLVTTSAVLTAVIGLAAQETLRDLFGGVSMQIGAGIRAGDWVNLGEHRGRVKAITLMNTVLSNVEGAEIVVPNSQAAATITRQCRAGRPAGQRFRIGLDYSQPPAQARQLLLDRLISHP